MISNGKTILKVVKFYLIRFRKCKIYARIIFTKTSTFSHVSVLKYPFFLNELTFTMISKGKTILKVVKFYLIRFRKRKIYARIIFTKREYFCMFTCMKIFLFLNVQWYPMGKQSKKWWNLKNLLILSNQWSKICLKLKGFKNIT